MTETPVAVTISFLLPGPDTYVGEAEAAATFIDAPDERLAAAEQEGLVEIACGDTQAALHDALLWLVPKLCVEAVDGVLSTGTAEVSLWTADAAVALVRDGDWIEVRSDIFEPGTFPVWKLLDALVDAAERFAGLLERIWPDDEVGSGTRSDMLTQIANTRAALDAARNAA